MMFSNKREVKKPKRIAIRVEITEGNKEFPFLSQIKTINNKTRHHTQTYAAFDFLKGLLIFTPITMISK